MLILQCRIKIQSKDTKNTIAIDYCNSISVSTSLTTLTDTAVVVLPCKVYDRLEHKPLRDFIGVGDDIDIEIGYKEYEQQKIFSGYITGVSIGKTITLACENQTWKLKQIVVTPKRYAKFSVKDFLSEYAPELDVNMPDEIDFGEVVINSETSISKVLDILQQKYSFKACIKDKTMYVFLTSTLIANKGNEVNIKIGVNSISDTLSVKKAKDIKILVNAKCIKADNTLLETSVGDKGGEVRTYYIPGCKDISELKKIAQQKHTEYEQDTIEGSLVLFGVPYVSKGDKIKIQDQERKEFDNKRFVIQEVRYSFDISGYRQTITLGGELK